MAYRAFRLEQSITIHKIYSIHYFEYRKDFVFSGESHDFWEFVCVDRGEVFARNGDALTLIREDDICFRKPNLFHGIEANGVVAPNLVVISFECNSPAMRFFEDRILRVDQTEKHFLAGIIAEAGRCLAGRLDNPYLQALERREDAVFGAEQMIGLYLEMFLLHLYRRYAVPDSGDAPGGRGGKGLNTDRDSAVFEQLRSYLAQHISEQLNVSRICRDNLLSRTRLQDICRKFAGMGVIECFNRMKIEQAQIFLREQAGSCRQIAERLGYGSANYFTRQFHQYTGMTPSEYDRSIKAIAEKKRNGG